MKCKKCDRVRPIYNKHNQWCHSCYSVHNRRLHMAKCSNCLRRIIPYRAGRLCKHCAMKGNRNGIPRIKKFDILKVWNVVEDCYKIVIPSNITFTKTTLAILLMVVSSFAYLHYDISQNSFKVSDATFTLTSDRYFDSDQDTLIKVSACEEGTCYPVTLILTSYPPKYCNPKDPIYYAYGCALLDKDEAIVKQDAKIQNIIPHELLHLWLWHTHRDATHNHFAEYNQSWIVDV